MIKIMLSAGEVSGDVHGAHLALELKKINPSACLFGMGGEKMKAAGVDIRLDLTKSGTVGIVEIFKHLHKILFGLRKAKYMLRKELPDVLVLIDYQGFNMVLAGVAKSLGVKTVYYIAPQEWLWGTPKGVKSVATTIDTIIAIFEDEAKIYREAGGNVLYHGNPNLDTARPTMQKKEFFSLLGLNDRFPTFGLFPGSRQQEIDTLTPVLIQTAEIIKKTIPNSQFILSLSSIHFKEKISSFLAKSSVDIKVVYGKSHDALSSSNVCVAASGTTIIEAAILNTPIIMIYKLSPVTYFFAKNIVKIRLKYYCMPNILADKAIVPEYIQEKAKPQTLADKAMELLTDTKTKETMIEGYKLIRSKLGSPGVVKTAAKDIFGLIRGKI